MKLSEFVKAEYGKSISECTNEELYYALLTLTKKMASGKQHGNSKKKLYYISAEFLIGKLLSNNLINLGIYDEVKEELAQNGKDICEIEEFENEPSLGNGGLGRLAACFIDSIATLGLNGDGVGLNYHFGLFRQIFENNMQTTVPDPWLTEKSWLTKTDVTYDIKFKGMTVKSRMYDIDVIGYNNTSNKLHLFDVESVDESIVEDGINFNKEDIKKNLTLFLYPDDSDEAGRILRIYQQYFMVSSAAQLILDECVAKGCNLHDLSDYVVIQINDTHPTMVIPELIRLLVERGLEMDEAIEVVTKSCAYTNHTILAEALEKWPIYYLKKAVPQLMPIIEVLDDKVRRKYHNQEVYIIDGEERVHMAHIDIHYSSSVNGVASLHTEILKNNELHHFYEIYPEKFNNKTNGITFRRWLLHCNPQLTELITSLIGDGFKKDATQLEKLLDYKNDEKVLKQLLEIKSAKKMELKKALMEKQLRFEFVDTLFSMSIGWAINSAMILLAAATFFVHGVSVSELQQAQELLVPLLGENAAHIFAIALLFAGIASTTTAGMAGVTIFSGMFGESYDMKDIHSRVGLLLTFVPAVIVLYFINDPFWGLIVSQMLLSVQLPLTVFMQIWLTSSPKVMGTYANKPFTKGLLYAVGIIVTALNLYLLYVSLQ